jgi:hypothetical protein
MNYKIISAQTGMIVSPPHTIWALPTSIPLRKGTPSFHPLASIFKIARVQGRYNLPESKSVDPRPGDEYSRASNLLQMPKTFSGIRILNILTERDERC